MTQQEKISDLNTYKENKESMNTSHDEPLQQNVISKISTAVEVDFSTSEKMLEKIIDLIDENKPFNKGRQPLSSYWLSSCFFFKFNI